MSKTTLWLVMTVLAGCGPGFASIKADSIATLELAAGAGDPCGRPGEKVLLVVTAVTKDGKRLRSATGADTEGKLDPKAFVFATNVGTVDRTGMLTMPANPLAALAPVEVTVHHKDASTPVARAALTFRFDCEQSTSFAGGDGAYGGEHYQYYGSGQAAPSGYNGSPGGNGGDGGSGASVDIHIGWLDVGDGRRFAIADVTDGSRRELYLLDPQGKGLTVDVSGGAGGAGGYGQPGEVAGNYQDPGTAGGNGGNGGNGGDAGTATVYAEDDSLGQLLWIKADPGAAGNGGEGGPGGPESDNADSTARIPGGPKGADGYAGQPGHAGPPSQVLIVASPTRELIAAAGGLPDQLAPSTSGRTMTAASESPTTSPPPPPRAVPQGSAPVAYSGELVVTMTVLKPAKAKPVTSKATGTARLSKDGGKNRLEFGAGCAIDLGARGAIKNAVCDNGQMVLRGLGGTYDLSAGSVSLKLTGTFALKPNKAGDKVASGKVTLAFHGKAD